MVRGGQTSYYHADALGTITHLTNSSGVVVQSYDYDSFGNISGQSGTISQPYTFTAREWDAETGLYYYQARYYDANVGRFITEDPIGLNGGINLYGYVGNNPLNHTDPFGLSAAIALPIGARVCQALSPYASRIIGLIIGGIIGSEVCKEKCKKPCPPCDPPVGTIGYRIDPVPPSKPHYPFKGTHVHLYRMNQNPNNCECFWQPIGVTEPPPPPGAVPL